MRNAGFLQYIAVGQILITVFQNCPDILQGIAMLLRQRAQGIAEVEIAYSRVVARRRSL